MLLPSTTPTVQGLRSAIAFLGGQDCHEEDRELLWALQHLRAGNPPSVRAWQALHGALVQGTLIPVLRSAGDSLDCLARLQRT